MKFAAERSSLAGQELMTAVLRPEADLESEYPLVFDEGGPGRILTLSDGERALSACAVLERELIHPGGKTRVGFIGSVSTHPDARGEGLATELLSRAEGEFRVAGCQHVMLWADDPGFYARRGYLLDGEETDFLVERIPQGSLEEDLHVRALLRGDEAMLHELYTWHAARVERSPEETSRLLSCPGMRVLLALRGTEVIAYVCFGRGGDLSGVAHEWGGEAVGVIACLNELLERRESVFLMAPGSPGPLGELLDSCGAIRAEGKLGMVKPLASARSLPQGAFIWGLDSI